MDYTGTGNSLNVRHPHSLQLIMDSLRYWVTEMHVDGFRFDLASTLAREFYEVDRLSTFFELVQQDPVVSQVKLIAEPWDVGPGGYQVGNFPPQWTEWNGAYRDTVRDFWRGEPSARRVRLPAGRVLRPLRELRSPTLRQHQLRHRPRRLHAARPGLLQREAQRGQRRGQQRRREPQPLLEPRRRGPDRRPRGPGAARPRAAQLPGHAAAEPGRADDPARRRAGPHPAGQQQHLRPGLRDLLGALGPGRQAADRVHRGARSGSGASTRRSGASGSSPAPPCAAARSSTTSSGCTPTAARWRTATGTSGGKTLGMYLNGHGIAGRDARGNPIIDDHFLLFFNVGDTHRADAAAGGVRRAVGPRHRHRWRGRQRAHLSGRRHASTCSTAPLVVLREHHEPEAEPDHSVAASLAANSSNQGGSRQ